MPRVDNVGGAGFTVDNGTGAAVRTKLQQVIDALRSLQSDSGDPTIGLAKYQLSINEVSASSQILKIRNKDNNGFTVLGDVALENLGLLPKTGGDLSGALGLSAGTNAAPSVNFTDTGTGFYRPASNQIAVSINQQGSYIFNNDGLSVLGSREVRYVDSTINFKYIGFKAPSSVANSTTFTLPNDDGPNGYALVTNGSGTLSWGVAGGGAVGGGSNEIFWENDRTITTDYAITDGKNAGSFGPITIQSGVTVTVGSEETWTVV